MFEFMSANATWLNNPACMLHAAEKAKWLMRLFAWTYATWLSPSQLCFEFLRWDDVYAFRCV